MVKAYVDKMVATPNSETVMIFPLITQSRYEEILDSLKKLTGSEAEELFRTKDMWTEDKNQAYINVDNQSVLYLPSYLSNLLHKSSPSEAQNFCLPGSKFPVIEDLFDHYDHFFDFFSHYDEKDVFSMNKFKSKETLVNVCWFLLFFLSLNKNLYQKPL